MDSIQKWITPRARKVILIVWALAFIILLAGMTDLFMKSTFQKKIVLVWFMIYFSLKAFFDFLKKTERERAR